jgi:ribonuclease BN (tRNA processing enzyme)
MPVTLQFVGTGDAFGSGGRFNTCFLLRAEGRAYLVDCGATSLVALRRAGVAPTEIDAILLTHLHGDHFGGVPFLLLDSRFSEPRDRPWIVAGPAGVEERVLGTLDLLFPGARTKVCDAMAVEFIEWTAREATRVGPLLVTPVPVVHPSGAPSFGLRIEIGSKAVAYSGDTEWTDALADLARDTDLFVCECYSHERDVPYHLSYRVLQQKRSRLATRRLVITHLSPDMLLRGDQIDVEIAGEGAIVEI